MNTQANRLYFGPCRQQQFLITHPNNGRKLRFECNQMILVWNVIDAGRLQYPAYCSIRPSPHFEAIRAKS